MRTYSLPDSMKAAPTAALVPPGQCQFGEDLTQVSLLERTQVSPTSFVLKFSLPDASQPLNLSTCACVLANATINGESVTRPYTPISTNATKGSFDLLIKNYGPEMGTMSYFLCETLKVGSKDVSFKHIPFNVKTQAPFDKFDQIGMLVGGTGITPMVQALHAMLGDNSKKKPYVTMLYGSRDSSDIVGKELLHKWAADHPDKFHLVDILSHEPSDSKWGGATGYIDKARIQKFFPAADSDESFQLWVCGPPPMYNALCGPREEKEVKGILGELNYTPEQVYKF